ncbi:trimethyllysine dioxygenase, mitochondrial-like [Pteropus medius]|uniref:trimethyllysine dioxygenase, mitochondrial-like n=1 Tax=Pteropus vampyrus TaxID=132908 RepID=UPI00196B1DB5|nr:trimethyllysine dioxygenase, mitochondrial-like [Pteropus giganteus]
MAGRRGAGPPGLLLGPKGLGEGRAGLTVSGEKQRAGARLPPEALLTCNSFRFAELGVATSSTAFKCFTSFKYEETGGRTLLVIGFYAAEQVFQKAPEEFELLSNVPLKYEYIENVGECCNHMTGVGPVLNIYPWNEKLYLIR